MPATLKNLLLLVIAVFIFSFADAQKIAHCNFDSLMNVMPEKKIADSLVQDYTAYLTKDYVRMQKELDSLNSKLSINSQIWSNEVLTQKQKELQIQINIVQEFRTESLRRIDARREELNNQLRKKILLAISFVAKENSYAYILNAAADNKAVLYFDQGNNVSKKVKNKMDYMQPAWVR